MLPRSAGRHGSVYSGRESIPVKARRVALCRDARSVRPLYQRLQHRSFNGNGRSTERPYKGLLVRCVAIVSSCFRITYEFQKQFPSWNFLVPREELLSSRAGTFRFQGWNSSVPRVELFGSNGGTLQFQRRNSSVPTEELFSSNGGTLQFQRRNSSIPREEKQNSSDL